MRSSVNKRIDAPMWILLYYTSFSGTFYGTNEISCYKWTTCYSYQCSSALGFPHPTLSLPSLYYYDVICLCESPPIYLSIFFSLSYFCYSLFFLSFCLFFPHFWQSSRRTIRTCNIIKFCCIFFECHYHHHTSLGNLKFRDSRNRENLITRENCEKHVFK